MTYGEMIKIALDEAYRYDYSLVFIHEVGDYTFIKYPETLWEMKFICDYTNTNKAVLVHRINDEVKIIKTYTEISDYITRG